MTYENPKLVLTFLGDDLEEGHSTVQTIDDSWIVNRSIIPSLQHLNGLKSSSDQYSITLFRRCPSVEDIISTEGNIKAKLYVRETVKFTGFISTSYSWAVTDHGEQALVLTIESIGTRLFSQPFLETGYYFFDCPASAAVYNLINPLGLRIRQGDERKIVQPVRREAEAGKTVRDLIDSLFYECNAIYWFNADGELCIEKINADTTSARLVDSSHLFHLRGAAISLSKALRTYKGARVRYTDTGTADNYLVYRNTSGQDQRYPYCHLKLGAGEWYDGAEIYTDQEWTAATADQFREPTLISAVNAGSESSIVGSGKIIAISNAEQNVVCESGITVQIEAVGGKWFKITAHNSSNEDKYITRMDLNASIVYEKNFGVIRTQIDGPTDGKSLFEEELSWIHDKDNAQRHANLLSQYYKSCGAVYTFYSDLSLTLGSVIELNDDVFSGLDVFVLVYAAKGLTDSELIEYKAVGVSTFNLDAPVWHGTTGSANPSGAQGPQGEPGATAEIQYALGSSITDPPGEEMQWSSDSMLWDVGDAPWQYTRLTGSTSWDAEGLGVFTTACPTQSKQGLGLIPGDYFTAGAQFVDGGVTYKKGYAYVYNGSSWDVLNLSNAENSGKALQCLSDLMTSGVNVTDSTASIWGWFEHLVAQDAVLQNLYARNVKVGDGNGTAGSGFRFRARDYDEYGNKLSSPDFDVYYGDKKLFDVDSSGKIYFGTGFWYNPSDTAIHSSNDGVVIDSSGSIIINNGMYKSDLICPSFRSVPRNTPISPIVVSNPSSPTALLDTVFPSITYDYYSCSVTGYSSIRYVQKSVEPLIHGLENHYLRFYDSSMNQVGFAWDTYPTYGPGHYTNIDLSSSTITIGTGSDVTFKLLKTDGSTLSIGSTISGLEKGELYYVADSGSSTGTLHIKL